MPKTNPNSEAIKLKVLGSGVIELLGRQVGRKWQTHSFFLFRPRCWTTFSKKIVASSSTVTPDPNPVCTVLANVWHII